MLARRQRDPMYTVSEDILDAAMAAYGVNKHVRADRERMRRAIEAASTAAFSEGYKKGFDAANYDDTGRS